MTQLGELDARRVTALLGRYGVRLIVIAPGEPIPGSYWGAPEAGLGGCDLFARTDTPAHSVLHELGHYVCMTPQRRARLWKDAGGDEQEECAVCYMQVLLCDSLPELPRAKLFLDMDAWGYSFREGGAERWFAGDGRFARQWLLEQDLISGGAPAWRLRLEPQSLVGFGASP